MILMIDNYDSFTYNLVQYFGELGADVKVVRNDEITIEEILTFEMNLSFKQNVTFANNTNLFWWSSLIQFS